MFYARPLSKSDLVFTAFGAAAEAYRGPFLFTFGKEHSNQEVTDRVKGIAQSMDFSRNEVDILEGGEGNWCGHNFHYMKAVSVSEEATPETLKELPIRKQFAHIRKGTQLWKAVYSLVTGIATRVFYAYIGHPVVKTIASMSVSLLRINLSEGLDKQAMALALENAPAVEREAYLTKKAAQRAENLNYRNASNLTIAQRIWRRIVVSESGTTRTSHIALLVNNVVLTAFSMSPLATVALGPFILYPLIAGIASTAIMCAVKNFAHPKKLN